MALRTALSAPEAAMGGLRERLVLAALIGALAGFVLGLVACWWLYVR